MRVIDISLPNPAENIGLDEVLLKLADAGRDGEVLRFWESPSTFVVLGRISKDEEDVNWDAVQRDRVPVFRRSSGGGTVVQGPGCLNFTLVLNKTIRTELQDLRQSYQWILGRVIRALAATGVKAVFRPISDLALADSDRKFSGNAQQRGRHFILHHGTILYQFDLPSIWRYLRMPRSIPDYRRSRSHEDFVANIACPPEAFKEALINVFAAGPRIHTLSQEQKSFLENFLAMKKFLVPAP